MATFIVTHYIRMILLRWHQSVTLCSTVFQMQNACIMDIFTGRLNPDRMVQFQDGVNHPRRHFLCMLRLFHIHFK